MSKKKIRDKAAKRRTKRNLEKLSKKRAKENLQAISDTLHEFDLEEDMTHEAIKREENSNKRELIRKSVFKGAMLLCPHTDLLLTQVRITDMSATGYGFFSGKKIKKGDYILMYNVKHSMPIRAKVRILWRKKDEVVYSYGCEMVW